MVFSRTLICTAFTGLGPGPTPPISCLSGLAVRVLPHPKSRQLISQKSQIFGFKLLILIDLNMFLIVIGQQTQMTYFWFFTVPSDSKQLP